MTTASNPAAPINNPLHHDLQRTLLLGLSRAPLSVHALALTCDLEAASPVLASANEGAIWQTLATRALMNRAGYIAPSVNIRLVPAPADENAKCPQKAEHIFALMHKDIHIELLDEWLYLLKTQHYSMPHAYLPALFDMGRKRSHLRKDILAVVDQRGLWLLAQHATWGDFYLETHGDPNKDWSTGNIKKRSEAFRTMRLQDPSTALAALQQEWPQESVESRTALLPLLGAQLSMADEAFLESVLDDARKDIRQIAQQLLRRLPTSRLVQRCTTYSASLLRLEKKLFRGNTLHVTLPETGDAALLRDGIYPERYRSLGDKASMLLYLIATVPPNYWLTTWQLTPQALLALIAGHEHQAVLLSGLLQACVHTLKSAPQPSAADIELYQRLLLMVADDTALLDLNPRATLAFSTLDVSQQAQTLQQWLMISSRDAVQARGILSLCNLAISSCHYDQIYLWPTNLSKLAAEQIRKMMQSNTPLWGMDSELSTLARSILLGPEIEQLSIDAARLPAAQQPSWERSIDGLRELISFRISLQQAFQP